MTGAFDSEGLALVQYILETTELGKVDGPGRDLGLDRGAGRV